MVGSGGALLAGTLTHLLPAAQGSSRLPILGHLPPILPPRGSRCPLRCSFTLNNSTQGLCWCLSRMQSDPWQWALKCRGHGSLPGQWPEDLRPWQHLPEHPSPALPLPAHQALPPFPPLQIIGLQGPLSASPTVPL